MVVAGHTCSAFARPPKMIADQMKEWLQSDACDGFNILFPRVPGSLDDFAARVVNRLQRRQLFRGGYEGKTLRENLRLPRSENRFFGKPSLVEALVLDLLFRALAFAQFRGALFFGAPETNPIFLGLGLGLGAPPLLAVLVEVDDHRL